MDNGRDETVEKHLRISRSFIRQAQAELDKGERLQASEKAWGAAAHAVKAVAEHREWQHRNHRHLFQTVSKLSHEQDDPELRNLFDLASALHQNFYEDWRTEDFVQDGIDHVSRLLEKLLPLAPSSPAR